MRFRFQTLAAALFFTCFAACGHTDDEAALVTRLVDSPPGEQVNSLVATDSALLAATGQAVYRSTNLGARWEQVVAAAGALEMFGPRIYLAAEGTLLRSDDHGRTWRRIPTTLQLKDGNDRVLLGIDWNDMAYFLSWDHGESWTRLPLPDSVTAGPNAHLLSDTVIYAELGGNFPDPGATSALTTNAGRTWEWLPRVERGIGSLARSDSVLWAHVWSDVPLPASLLRSDDYGRSWSREPFREVPFQVRAFPQGRLLVTGEEFIFFREPWAPRWAPVRLPDASITNTLLRHGGFFFAATGKGVFRADTAAGAHWTPASAGIPMQPLQLLRADSSVYLRGAQHLFRRDAAGRWNEEPVPTAGASPPTPRAMLGDANGLTVLSWTGIYQRGSSGWSSTAPFDERLTRNAVRVVLGGTGSTRLVALRRSDRSDVYRWSAGEPAWTPVRIDGAPFVLAFAVRDTVLYAATSRGVLKSLDEGVTWDDAAPGLARGVQLVASAGRWLLAATDAGIEVLDLTRPDARWERRTASGLRGNPLAMWSDPAAPHVVIVGTAEGLFWSRDLGTTFTQARDEEGRLFGTHIHDLLRHGDTILVAAATGLFEAPDRIPRYVGPGRIPQQIAAWVRERAREPWFWVVGPVASAVTVYLIGMLALVLLAWRRGSRVFASTWLREKATKPLLAVPGLSRRVLFLGYTRRVLREDVAVRAASAGYFGLPAEPWEGAPLLPTADGTALHTCIATAMGPSRPVLLVGTGGAGKTTVLARLTYLALKGTPPAGMEMLRPVLVPASYFRGDLPGAIADVLRERHGVQVTRETMAAQFESGGFLVLFDGVSEVDVDDQRRAFEEMLRTARSAEYAACRFVFAMRPLLDLPMDVPSVRLLPLTQDTVSLLLDGRGLAARQAEHVRHQLRGFGGRRIAPLLFAMAMADSESGEVSRTRSELYGRYFRRLLKLSEDGPQWAGWRRMLSHVAGWSLLEAGVRGVGLRHLELVSRLEAKESLNGVDRSIAEQLREFYGVPVPRDQSALWVVQRLADAGLLAGDATGRWRFAHDTFEEYFAAARLMEILDETGRWPALSEWRGDAERAHAFAEVLSFARELMDPAQREAVLRLDLPAVWRTELADGPAEPLVAT